MSAIPPSIPASVLQSTQAQQQAVGIQKADTDAQDQAFRAEIRAVEQRDGTVFSGDDDTRINPDGGGTGGQGRAFREGGEETPATEEESRSGTGITIDESGQPHVDLEA
jgi:hypothetical protein